MNRKVFFKKVLLIMLLIATSNVKLFGGDLKYTLYAGLGNPEPSENVNPIIFRTFNEWDNYIERHFLQIQGASEFKITYKWKSDSAKFNQSVSIAFEGNKLQGLLMSVIQLKNNYQIQTR